MFTTYPELGPDFEDKAPRKLGLPILRSVVFGIPIVAWLFYFLFIVLGMNGLSGCAALGFLTYYLYGATLAMWACLVPAIVLGFLGRMRWDWLGVVANMSWLILFWLYGLKLG